MTTMRRATSSKQWKPTQRRRKVVARRSLTDPVDNVTQVVDGEMHAEITAGVDGVHMDQSIFDYLMDIISRTRATDRLVLGVGPRGGMALHRSSRALALVRGRDFCLVDDVKEVAVPVLAHRVIPIGDTFGLGVRDTAVRVLREILSEVEIPL